MAKLTERMGPALNWARLPEGIRLHVMAGPMLVIIVLAMMILPLPPVILDLFFTFNISLAIMVLLVSMFTNKPLEFAAFPAVLLFSTLLRLALNVASTRVVLMEGHQGGDAAGKVIEAFGAFLIGGNFAVGLVVFAILVIINFMVITKGAGRIAEVGARFMLDAMPGKQMAIDADLNAGLIGEAEAKERRLQVSQEADFYGSMDGASKFVRGDAVAGLIIMLVNIIGGLLIGVVQHGMDAGTAAETYTLLTIGDGLVAQIPALVISTAAGVMVSRVDTDEDVGQQVIGQLFVNPRVLALTAVVMGLLGLVPGMPNFMFLLITACLGGLAWYIDTRDDPAPTEPIQEELSPVPESLEASWEDVQFVDALGLEVGHRLIPMVDQEQDGKLLSRIKSVRKKFAQSIGFLPPVVHIKDNLELGANQYTILLKEAVIGGGEVYPERYMAIDPGNTTGRLQGIDAQDPAFGLPAVWIESDNRDRAQIYGYTVVDASTVVATHLNHLMQMHASELLSRSEVKQLLDRLGEDGQELVSDVVDKRLSVAHFQRVLQELLRDQVPIRDIRGILEALADGDVANEDLVTVLEKVRVALGRTITQRWFGAQTELQVIGLDQQLEDLLMQATESGALDPGLGETIITLAGQALHAQEEQGGAPVVVVRQVLRRMLNSLLQNRIPGIAVMSDTEIPIDKTIRITNWLGGNS
ncbi:flagellar biosynthesis protein FlhA [Halioglobus japonicus]|nr:flagellar biosynthesis protein FlhA [Halioglobus japonicus]